MQLRNRKKHLAEVNMSSMADIIFMLMVFFMITSTLVRMYDYDLPESSTKAKAPNKLIVEIRKEGEIKVNKKLSSKETLEADINAAIIKMGNRPEDVTVTINAELGTPTEIWDLGMRAANRMRAKSILATQPPR
jgi:biopolymer transport protein ExbD